MEMNQVRYFLAICEHRNFTKAASSANVSQPALTAAIKKLEAELGGALFLRDRSGCQLTPLGQALRPRIERILEETRSAELDAIRYARLARVPIRIGLANTVGLPRFLDGLASLQGSNPTLDIELLAGNFDDHLKDLRNGTLDMLVAPADCAPPDLYQATEIGIEIYHAVFSRGHKFEKLKHVPIDALTSETYLDRPNCEMREKLHQLIGETGEELYAAYRSNRDDWLIAMASKGLGIAVLPTSSLGTGEVPFAHKQLGEEPITRTLCSWRYRHHPMRVETTAVINCLKLALV